MRPDAAWAIRFEGASLPAAPGQSVAASLLASGHVALGTAKDGTPRGAFCGMGACHDCLVTIDGEAGIRACMTKVRDGMRVSRQPQRLDAADTTIAALAEPPAFIPEATIDLLVIGAGPAGLAAAEAAAEAGASVLVVDERPAAGGQYYKQPATRAAESASDAQAREGAALIARVTSLGVERLAASLVWGAERDTEGRLTIGCLVGTQARKIHPRLLVIATGAVERPPVLPGWTLPGVMATGAVQTLLRSDGVVPKGRILVAGNGPLNLQVAADLATHGATVAGVIEAAPAPWTRPRAALALLRAGPALTAVGLQHLAALKRAGVPVLWASRLRRLDGRDRVAQATVEAIGGSGGVELFKTDLVAVGDGFRPANELPRLLGCRHEADGRGGLAVLTSAHGETSLPDVFVVGEAGRFGGAAIAKVQGALAGRAVARRLGRAVAGNDGVLLRRLARGRTFQRALWSLFDAVPPGLSRADAATLVCRCEAVTLATLQTTIAANGVADLATLKRLTRAGMGRCQGRYCAESLSTLIGIAADHARSGFAPQMPLRPIPLAALAVEKPEWGGHRRSQLPTWAPKYDSVDPAATTKVDVVVIGAGIVGLSSALFLARAGHDVLVVDRAQPNALASGGNAGSLHAQLLSFDHGVRAEAGGGPAARTLTLQRDSIALWIDLERDLGRDFEIKVTGGLMVAETERDLAFLTEKTRVERANGIDCTIIGAADLRALEPALSDGFLGASYCAGEGKINPLLATHGILDAALAAGARLMGDNHVRAITREGARFVLETARGRVVARRVVNAAGAFASAIGRMLGVDVPVYGAPLQMVVTEAVAPLVRGLVAHADRHLTLKQAANGNILIGGGWTAGLDPVHHHPRPSMASLEGNLWVAQHVVPALRKLHVIRSWAAMNINIDGAPILGEDPRVPGLFHAVTSNGYTLGPLMGRITAQLIGDGVTDRDVTAFSIARFGSPA